MNDYWFDLDQSLKALGYDSRKTAKETLDEGEVKFLSDIYTTYEDTDDKMFLDETGFFELADGKKTDFGTWVLTQLAPSLYVNRYRDEKDKLGEKDVKLQSEIKHLGGEMKLSKTKQAERLGLYQRGGSSAKSLKDIRSMMIDRRRTIRIEVADLEKEISDNVKTFRKYEKKN